MNNIFRYIVIFPILCFSLSAFSIEIIDGEEFPDKLSRDVGVNSAQEKSDLRSCKGSDKFKSIWICT